MTIKYKNKNLVPSKKTLKKTYAQAFGSKYKNKKKLY